MMTNTAPTTRRVDTDRLSRLAAEGDLEAQLELWRHQVRTGVKDVSVDHASVPMRRCSRCNAELTDPVSRDHGIGPVCRGKDNALFAREYTDAADMPAALAALGDFTQNDHGVHPTAMRAVASAIECLAHGRDNRAAVASLELALSFPMSGAQVLALHTAVGALGYVRLVALMQGDTTQVDAVLAFIPARDLLVIRGPKRYPRTLRERMELLGGRWDRDESAVVFPYTEAAAVGLLARACLLNVDLESVALAVAAAQAHTPIPRTVRDYTLQVTAPGLAVLKSPWNPAFLEDFKREIPRRHRTWNAARKVWTIRTQRMIDRTETLCDLYFATHINGGEHAATTTPEPAPVADTTTPDEDDTMKRATTPATAAITADLITLRDATDYPAACAVHATIIRDLGDCTAPELREIAAWLDLPLQRLKADQSAAIVDELRIMLQKVRTSHPSPAPTPTVEPPPAPAVALDYGLCEHILAAFCRLVTGPFDVDASAALDEARDLIEIADRSDLVGAARALHVDNGGSIEQLRTSVLCAFTAEVERRAAPPVPVAEPAPAVSDALAKRFADLEAMMVGLCDSQHRVANVVQSMVMQVTDLRTRFDEAPAPRAPVAGSARMTKGDRMRLAVLASLAEHGPCSIRTVTDSLAEVGLKRTTRAVGLWCRRLVKDGLATSEHNPGSSTIYALTDAGRETCAELGERAAEAAPTRAALN